MTRLPEISRLPEETRTCPWCEGRKVTGQLAHGEEPEFIVLLGRKIPVAGTMLDKACGFCEGRGVVPKHQTQLERWEELDAKRKRDKPEALDAE